MLRIKVSSLVDDILDGKVDIETCGECNNQIMDELQKRLTKIEDDTNAFKTAIEAFGQDDQVSLSIQLKWNSPCIEFLGFIKC